jgi:hypothetical protein
MAYYSRYAIERKDVVFGVPLLRLVTSEPWAYCFSKTWLPRALPSLFQVPVIRPSFTRVSNFDWIHSLLLVITNYNLGSSLLPPPQHECGYCTSCTHPFTFGRSSEVVSEHTLKLTSYTNDGHHPFTLELEQGYHVYARDSSTEGEVTWWTKSSPWADYCAISSFRINDIIHHSPNFPSFHNVRMRFHLRGEGCDIPCHENPKALPLIRN